MKNLFNIGQKVVALRDHSQKNFIKGHEYIVLDITKTCCSYGVKINSSDERTIMRCGIHGLANPTEGSYYSQENFAPIQEISDFTFEEAIELVTEKVTV